MTVHLKMSDSKHYIGHRQRLKQKILESKSLETFPDYELIELLLCFSIPRKDVKPLAKKLLDTFGSVDKLINVDLNKLNTIEGTNTNIYVLFLAIKDTMRRILAHKVFNQNVIGSWSALLDYLTLTLGNSTIEQFRILFLNKKNVLIADEILGSGTVDQTPVYPREIIKRALFHEATSLILVHNHPSGSSKPSKADIDITARIVEACNSINISVHDHVIITNGEFFSFKSNLLL